MACEVSERQLDLGIRAGADSLHPLFRSNLITSFASWNLLDLWNHKDIKSACAHALEDYAASTASGRWLGGLNSRLSSCEARSAQFISGESALLFSNRNQAILTLVTALATGGGVVLGPAMSALPLADACALVDLEFIEFESHDDYQKAIERKQSSSRIMVFAETVSAFTGKRLDLPKILALVNQHNCWLALDESWAIGYSGLRGAGSAETIPNSPQLLARIFSSHILSGSLVTALTCLHDVKELLLLRSRYLKIEPPPSLLEVAGLNAAMALSELAITQLERLSTRARTIHLALKEQGWRVISNDDHQ